VVEEIQSDIKVGGIRVKNVISGAMLDVAFQGVFIFVGIIPITDFIKNILKVNDSGFVSINQKMQTSKEGIFACGDCADKSLYQVISACAEGAIAADAVHKYLLNS
jgi:thioredoxin reductase (NADPH)